MPNHSKDPLYNDWGLTDYNEALERQRCNVTDRIEEKIADQLIFTEHKPVFTLGSRIGAEKNVLLNQDLLKAKGIALIESNRGGDVTYHGPGQLVAYPIVSLDEDRDLHQYLRKIEQVIINALGTLGLSTHRNPGKTGIWLNNRKIAAIGVAVKKWITYHGFAININNDLTPFSYINPCGIQANEGTVTSLKAELNTEIDFEEVKKVVAVEFWALFNQ